MAHAPLHVTACVVDLAATSAPDTALLDSEERERAARFRTDALRQRWVMSRLALRSVLAAATGTDPAAISFAVDDNRKPHLAPELGVQFNLSHSSDRALIGVCREAAIGVDIEEIRSRARLADIAGRFFSAAEQAALADYPDGADYRAAFYRIWTRKEAVIKATGEGLSAALDAFDVAVGQTAAMQADRNPGRSAADWQLAHVAAGGDYVGAIAVRTPRPIMVEYLDDWRQAA